MNPTVSHNELGRTFDNRLSALHNALATQFGLEILAEAEK